MNETQEESRHSHKLSLAWARLNAYGLLLVGLLLMTVFEVLHPESSIIARTFGAVPYLQPLWQIAYLISGLLILAGFLFANTLPEALGLLLMTVALAVQTVTMGVLLGFDSGEFFRQALTFALVLVVVALRASAFLSKSGLTVIISGRRR